MPQTAEEYYTNKENHGNYQYIPISQVIDSISIEAESDNDSYLKGIPRHLFIKYAVDGVREMNFSGNGDTLGLELSIGDDLQMILPQDYVDYTEVFVIGEDCKLYLLDYNSSINSSPTYLQDHKYAIVFDSEGDEIELDGNNIYNKLYTRYEFAGNFYNYSKQSNIDTSKLSKHGEFLIDKKRGVIGFSSNLRGKNIVLRYISDGLQQKNIDGDKISVHKHLKNALEHYIYLRAIERRRNVPEREKQRANKKYKTAKHKAAILLKDINSHRIAKAMRSVFKPNKF
ncbi:hypothetical protein [Aquimarina longa]|uniref:hypothetical protein n=1 Tax=Aquimarina longa TaxID=1080221 RepID=UPI000784A25B|nr:hypothetical protein [Aquimarina longa]